MNRPVLTIFAGINGAGKSTIYDKMNEKLGIRINPDEIAKELGDFNDPKIQRKAGKLALELINYCKENNLSFNQETVLAGKQPLNLMKDLKEQGYRIDLYYVGLNNKELAVERVKFRVEAGGHNINEDLIRKRYDKSLENLPTAINLSDNAKVYDNSNFGSPKLLMIMKDKEIIYKDNELPNWFEKEFNKYLNEFKDKNEKFSIRDKLKSIKENKKNNIKENDKSKDRNFER
ncbi:zeta toxin family protein [Clostridium perfringens]|uniref:zeta toxin family protein n=1 Tax=Clostridium perfringens TaxID=1502 RepID=UPI0024BBFB8D|nr:zeta toxin family protein [Clostridium perfringens]